MIDEVYVEPTNKLGGTNHQDRQFRVNGQRLEFIPTLTPIISLGLFGLMMLLPFGFIAFMFYIDAIQYGLIGALCYVGTFAVCSVICIWAFKRVTYPIYFDLSRGYFHSKHGRRSKYVKISDISRIHVVRKWVFGGNSNFKSFEFLLILNDCSKIMVVDHSNGSTIKKEAEDIAERLNIPWSYSIYE